MASTCTHHLSMVTSESTNVLTLAIFNNKIILQNVQIHNINSYTLVLYKNEKEWCIRRELVLKKT